MSPALAEKTQLRRRLLAARRARPPRPADDAARLRLLLALPEVADARCVAAYVHLPGEPATRSLLDTLLARNVRVLLPVTAPDRSLTFRAFTGELVAGTFGVDVPPGNGTVPLTDADVVIVPALAVDRTGRRLGRGGGSYDRALAPLRATRPQVPVLTLLYEGEVLADVPAEPHDVPVDAAVTERRATRTGR